MGALPEVGENGQRHPQPHGHGQGHDMATSSDAFGITSLCLTLVRGETGARPVALSRVTLPTQAVVRYKSNQTHGRQGTSGWLWDFFLAGHGLKLCPSCGRTWGPGFPAKTKNRNCFFSSLVLVLLAWQCGW